MRITPYVTVGIIFALGFLIASVILLALWIIFDRSRHRAELERFANLLTVGTLDSPEAEIVNAPPDAVARARERVHEDRVSNGILVLKDKYAQQGLTITDEEARVQVEAMLVGNSPV